MSPSRAELEEQGWQYRFTASDPALSEHVDSFRSLGFEVHLERLARGDAPDASCSTCLDGEPVFALYVRRPHSP